MVAPLTRFTAITAADAAPPPAPHVTNASILLLVEDGVIEAVNPVMSTKERLVVLNDVSLTTFTTCNTLPAGNLAAGNVPEVAKVALADPICAASIRPVICVFATLNALFYAPVITPLLSNVNETVLAEPPTVTDVILFDT